jgi:hypothetical protein
MCSSMSVETNLKDVSSERVEATLAGSTLLLRLRCAFASGLSCFVVIWSTQQWGYKLLVLQLAAPDI